MGFLWFKMFIELQKYWMLSCASELFMPRSYIVTPTIAIRNFSRNRKEQQYTRKEESVNLVHIFLLK